MTRYSLEIFVGWLDAAHKYCFSSKSDPRVKPQPYQHRKPERTIPMNILCFVVCTCNLNFTMNLFIGAATVWCARGAARSPGRDFPLLFFFRVLSSSTSKICLITTFHVEDTLGERVQCFYLSISSVGFSLLRSLRDAGDKNEMFHYTINANGTCFIVSFNFTMFASFHDYHHHHSNASSIALPAIYHNSN